MSGSGGFYKYRCKNFYSHNCVNWVWVNNTPCATCVAEGREDIEAGDDEHSHRVFPFIHYDIMLPSVHNGVWFYEIRELIPPMTPDQPWTLGGVKVDHV